MSATAFAQMPELEGIREKFENKLQDKVEQSLSEQDKSLVQSQLQSQLKQISRTAEGLQKHLQAPQGQVLKPIEISLSTAILFALHNNPDVEIQRQRMEQAKLYREEGKAAFKPQITMKMNIGSEYDKPTASADGWKSDIVETGDVNVILEQLVYDGKKSKNEVLRRNELINSGKMKTEIKAQEVISDTIKHYLAVLRYQNAVRDTRVFLERIKEITEIVTDMYEAGGTSKTTLDYAESRLASAEAEMNRTLSSLNTSISKLEFLTGKLPPFMAVPPTELEPDKYDMKFYLDLARAGNMKIRQNSYEKEAANYKVRAEEARFKPEVSFQLEGIHSYNDGGDVGPDRSIGAMLRIDYTLFDGAARHYSKERYNSVLRELEIKDMKIMKELQRDLELAYNQVISLESTIRSTEAEIRSNMALQELNRENFKLGEINIIELIEGEERLNASRIKRHQLRADLMKSAYNLMILAGELTDQYFCKSCEVTDDVEETVGRLHLFD